MPQPNDVQIGARREGPSSAAGIIRWGTKGNPKGIQGGRGAGQDRGLAALSGIESGTRGRAQHWSTYLSGRMLPDGRSGLHGVTATLLCLLHGAEVAWTGGWKGEEEQGGYQENGTGK